MNNDMISLRVFSVTSCLNASMSSVARALGDYLYYTSSLSLFSKIYRRRRRRPGELHEKAITLSKLRDIYPRTRASARAKTSSVVVVEKAERQTHTHTQRERERDLKSAEKTRGTSLLFFVTCKLCAL